MSYKDKLAKTSDKIRNDLNAKLHGKTYTFNLPTFQGFGGGSFGGAGAGDDWKEYPNNYVELPQYERRTPIITKESFSQAFNRARIKGDPTFEFNGKIYTTEISDNPQYIGKRYQDKTSAVLREVLDDKMKVMSDSTRVEPFIGQLLGIRKRDESEYKYLDGGVLFGKSGIHIKKENIGSFTRYCGGNVTQECIERGKNSPSAAIRKKATFAANARRWKHENGGILKAQEGTGNKFWSKLWNAVKAGGMMARDAKIGAIGAQQVRDLYSEGKNQEAQDLAKQYAKANTTGIALAGGAASTGLLGDLIVTGATTAADTFIDGDTENFGKNLVKNTVGDLIGHGVFKGLKYFNGKPIFVKEMKNGIGDGLYHLDYGDAKGAFKSGSYVKNGYLYPGKTDLDGQLDYIWFNESKPYATAVHGKPFSRTIIFEQKDVPGILRVREQNHSIGQWNGKNGFVTKHEMVTSNPVDMDNATIYKRIPAFNIWLRTK